MPYFPSLNLSILTKICSLIFEYMSYYLLLNWRNVRHHPDPFEYMSYYLLLKLELLGHAASWFEYMSYYLLLKLSVHSSSSAIV